MVTPGESITFHGVSLPYRGTGSGGLLKLQCSAKGKLRAQVTYETWHRWEELTYDLL